MSGNAPRKDLSTGPKSTKAMIQFAGLAAALMALIEGSPGAATQPWAIVDLRQASALSKSPENKRKAETILRGLYAK
jgi:hypothetical protein